MAKAPTKKKVAVKPAPSTRTSKTGWTRTVGKNATLGKRAT